MLTDDQMDFKLVIVHKIISGSLGIDDIQTNSLYRQSKQPHSATHSEHGKSPICPPLVQKKSLNEF